MGCEVLDEIENRGYEKGFQLGLEEGFEEGVEKANLNAIRAISKTFDTTAEEAMDILEIPAEKRLVYSQKI